MIAPMVYELRKPMKIDPTKSYPALFVLHGMGSNEQNMLSLVEGLEDQFFIFSIRGPLSQGVGYAYFSIQGYGKPHREIFDQSIEKITCFIDYAEQQYPIDHNNLYFLGFSQGSILSMSLGLTLGNRIKGIVALSGYIPAFVKEEYNGQPLGNLSVFISHGVYDNILPYEWGEAAKEEYQKLGANVLFKSYEEGHTVSLSNQADFMNWLRAEII
ncbi:MAG: esterase [Bacillus sp. (in: firmicutes)]